MQGEDHALGDLCGCSVKRWGPPGVAVSSTPDSQEAGRENQHWCCRAKQRAGDGALPGPLSWSRRPGQTRLPTSVSEQELKEVWHSAPLQLGEPLRP